MAGDASYSGASDRITLTTETAVAVEDVRQLADGQAGVYTGILAAAAAAATEWRTDGQFTFPKPTTFVALKGGRAYWDHSASTVSFRKVGDRDFYLGRFVNDAALADTTCTINLNVPERLADIDLLRDAYLTVPVGTQALGGFLPPQRCGGSLTFLLSATNEAQKVDALSVDSFSKNANAIVEMIWRVPSDGAGTVVDVSLGIANGTHATDADAITNHLFVHLDANATAINLQSKDGTTTVTATDTTTDYTEGSALANRKEVWFDLRNPADVQVYVDGVNVLPTIVFDLSAAGSEFQLLAHVEKTASTDAYELALERLCARFAEQ